MNNLLLWTTAGVGALCWASYKMGKSSKTTTPTIYHFHYTLSPQQAESMLKALEDGKGNLTVPPVPNSQLSVGVPKTSGTTNAENITLMQDQLADLEKRVSPKVYHRDLKDVIRRTSMVLRYLKKVPK